MKWILPNNKIIDITVARYMVDWDKKAPSKGAQSLKNFLRLHCSTHVILEEFKIPKTLLRADFVDLTLKVAFEFDGVQHETFNKHFHRNKIGFLNSLKRDTKKDDQFILNGFTVIRLNDKDLPLTKQFIAEEFEVYL